MKNSIEQAIKLIESNQYGYYNLVNYCPIYLFTTENIKGITNSLNVTNKNILTVSSSGDHILNMLLNGATNIESYDINFLTKYYFYLKEAAIRTLNYNEFLTFFFPNKLIYKNKVFAKELFNKMLPNFKDEEAKIFWQTLFNKYSGKKIYYSNLFIRDKLSSKTYLECNNYMNNEENYKKLQQLLNNYKYKFYLANVFEDISNFPDRKYDIIYLSNILDKLYCCDSLIYVKKVKEIITNLKKYLVTNGILGVCYLYCYQDEYWDELEKCHLSSRIMRYKYFNNDEYSYKQIDGISDLKGKNFKNRDALMLTRKK